MTKLINFRAEDGRGAFPNETPYQLRLNYSVASWLALEPIIPRPPVVGDTLLCIDESKWNGPVNHAQAIERGIRAFWIKADQGVWTDSLFEDHVEDAESAGADFGFYHFCDPEQTSVSPEDAARHCANMTDGIGTLSTWLDVERRGNLSTNGLLDYLIRWVDTYQEITNKMVEIYTRLSLFNRDVARSNYWRGNKIRLNAARYHLGLSTPWSDGSYRPIDWDYGLGDFDLWQYSADGNGLGSWFGAQSNSIDLNLFYGNEADFIETYDLEDETPEPPVDPDLEKRIEALELKTSDNCQRITALENQISELNDKHESDVADLDKRIEALEQSEPPTGELSVVIT